MNDNPLKLLLKVDESGKFLGFERKDLCHSGDGVRHHAYLVILIDEKNRLMLARRSRFKLLWPDFWDGTIASHYYSGEKTEAAVRNRIVEETGSPCRDLRFALAFAYESRYLSVGIEKEFCDIFIARMVSADPPPLNPAEVSECRFETIGEIADMISGGSLEFTPWFEIAFRKCREHGFL